MEEYARRKNVERWTRELKSEDDPVKRAQLERFLAEELQELERLAHAPADRGGGGLKPGDGARDRHDNTRH